MLDSHCSECQCFAKQGCVTSYRSASLAVYAAAVLTANRKLLGMYFCSPMLQLCPIQVGDDLIEMASSLIFVC